MTVGQLILEMGIPEGKLANLNSTYPISLVGVAMHTSQNILETIEEKDDKANSTEISFLKRIRTAGVGILGTGVGILGTILAAIGTLTLTGAENFIETYIQSIIDKQNEITNTYNLYTTQFEDSLLDESREITESKRYKILYEYPGIFENGDLNEAKKIILEESEEIKEHIIQLINYYKKVTNCVDKKICDKDTAEVLFKETISNFKATFAPRICESAKDNIEWLEKDTFGDKSSIVCNKYGYIY